MYNLEIYLFLKPSASLLFLSIDFLSSKNWFLLKVNTIFKENVDQGEILHTRANILHFSNFYLIFFKTFMLLDLDLWIYTLRVFDTERYM